jgi:hypothetical protein
MLTLLEIMRTSLVETSGAGYDYPSGEYEGIASNVLILSRRVNISFSTSCY